MMYPCGSPAQLPQLDISQHIFRLCIASLTSHSQAEYVGEKCRAAFPRMPAIKSCLLLLFIFRPVMHGVAQ